MQVPHINLTKKHVQIITSVVLVLAVVTTLIFSYPWLQMQLASLMLTHGNYEQAEQILIRLNERRPEWTRPRQKLIISQLHLGKHQQAAQTVISLADRSSLDPAMLALTYADVARELISSGHSSTALELSFRVLNERNDPLLKEAVMEICFQIAETGDLTLALNGINLALDLAEENWNIRQRAFNILLTKALEAPASQAEPILDRALDLYPYNTLAVTHKAKILANREGAEAALDYMVSKEHNILNNGATQEYMDTKRDLVLRLAERNEDVDLSPYIAGMGEEELLDFVLQGLRMAWNNNQTGEQFYRLFQTSVEVVYAYGRNLFETETWSDALSVFQHLQTLDPEHSPYDLIFAALRSKTDTTHQTLSINGRSVDMAQISPNGNFIAFRRWQNYPWLDENVRSQLVLRDLSTSRDIIVGTGDQFAWSANSNWLAHVTTSNTGMGTLRIYDLNSGENTTLAEDYNVMNVNWANNTLLVQAEEKELGDVRLLSYSLPELEPEVKEWELSGDINQTLHWYDIGSSRLDIYQGRNRIHSVHLDNQIVSVSRWSPDGRYLVIESIGSENWLYDNINQSLTQIDLPGQFAAWGSGNQLYWYHPLWESDNVLVRLNTRGEVVSYLPYSFSVTHYDLSVSNNANKVVWVVDDQLKYSRR
ncbi:MAG: hypothetical protein FH749_09935 [Firmicutes bacterium]|nr:hypothetical protein [Bacillota bacterium]